MWSELNTSQKITILKRLFEEGHTQASAAEYFDLDRISIGGFCLRHKIKTKYSQGAQPNNTNAMTHGLGVTTIKRRTKNVLEKAGRDLHTCERCGAHDPFTPYPRHHKDRNKLNNTPENLEVLCHACHNNEHESERTRNELGQYV